jgi:hypothetical protein
MNEIAILAKARILVFGPKSNEIVAVGNMASPHASGRKEEAKSKRNDKASPYSRVSPSAASMVTDSSLLL